MLRIRTKEHITQAEKKIAEERQKNKTPQIKKVEDAINTRIYYFLADQIVERRPPGH